MNSATKVGLLGLACLAAPFILIIALLFFITAVEEEQQALACTPGFDPGAASGTAVVVDPATVPSGPIAGYAGQQLVNAAIIMAAARQLGLSLRDQQIGVMTAMGESSLVNIDHGDAAGPDSRGLFQQRDNGAWGTLEDRMDPATAATNFFRALAAVTDRNQLEPTIAAHRVQRNADPYHYRPYWSPAVEVVAALAGTAGAVPVGDTSPSSEDPYNLGDVKPQLRRLVAVLAPMFNITTVGGYRASARDPDGHPSGLAADFMVSLDEAGKATGDALAGYAQAHAAELKIDYIIWQQRIWSSARSAEGWRPMEDRGSPTQNHRDHVHINALPDTGPIAHALGLTNPQCVSGLVAAAGSWVEPIEDARVTSPFGWRTHPEYGDRRFHDGVDYGAACGTPIRAAAAGTVTRAGTASGFGNLIEIDHGGGIVTGYGHMFDDGLRVRVGDVVTAGQVIALVGSSGTSTGCHLHFRVKVDGEVTDPIAFLADPPTTETGDGIRLVSFNALGHSHTKPGGNKCCKWAQSPARTAGLVQALRGHGLPDVLGLQEFTGTQLRVFNRLAGDTYATFGSKDNHIAWRRDRFTVVDRAFVVIPYFRGQPRKMPVVTLTDRTTGITLTIINVHNPTSNKRRGNNERHRRTAVKREIATARAALVGGSTAAVLLGDFNERGQAYCQITAAGLTAANGGQSAAAGTCRPPTPTIIDWIFAAGLPLRDYTADASVRGTISDHRMILATLG